jgi:chromatin remodeling complex protein RSC6
MKIWKYIEEKDTHLLVKFYKEDHGEGEFLGDLDEESIKKLILEIKPDINLDQAFGTLSYFGLLPILTIK